jgi:RNA polymerase sigma-70 factor, ECF subfamily
MGVEQNLRQQSSLKAPLLAGSPGTPDLHSSSRCSSFEELTVSHLHAVYRLAVRLTGSAVTAEDLTQETYLKALQAFPSLREPSRVRAWLFQILSRLVTDRHRSGNREVPIEELTDLERFSLYDRIAEEDPFPYSDRLHQDFLSQFEDDDVQRALQSVPEVYRTPLVLLYTEELSYRELADVLGCPVGTVMSRLYRGRKVLERALWDCAKRRGWVKEWKP